MTRPGSPNIKHNYLISLRGYINEILGDTSPEGNTGITYLYVAAVLNRGNFSENVMITAYCNLTADKTIGTQLIVSLLPNENKTITPDLKCLGGCSMQKPKGLEVKA